MWLPECPVYIHSGRPAGSGYFTLALTHYLSCNVDTHSREFLHSLAGTTILQCPTPIAQHGAQRGPRAEYPDGVLHRRLHNVASISPFTLPPVPGAPRVPSSGGLDETPPARLLCHRTLLRFPAGYSCECHDPSPVPHRPVLPLVRCVEV